MFEVFRNTKNNEPIVIAVLDIKTNHLVGLLAAVIQKEYPGIFGSLTARSIIFGGPLIVNEDVEITELLVQHYNEIIKKRVIYSQVRNLWKQDSSIKTFKENGYKYEEHLNILVDLQKNEDELWKDVHSKRRNEIRRARKEGTIVQELKNEVEIKEAYNILKEVYGRARLPLHDRSMFKAAYDILLPQNMIKFFGAINDGKIIGTIVVLCYKDRIYDWYAGSYREFYGKYPNDLLPWGVFLWGKKNGFKVFDFGGAGKPGVPYGVRDYKLKFGGNIVNYGRYNKIHHPIIYIISSACFKLWKLGQKTR
jgi:lipid II:glycine glycyltransferase (peptidoglycan interpeptide bridge formation enzyme)